MTRLTIALTAVLALALSVGVFRITYQVDELEKQLHSLNKEILDEQETIHILKAEWSYLNDPSRLESLAKRYLDLKEMSGEQLVTFDSLNNPAPLAPDPNTTPAKLEQ